MINLFASTEFMFDGIPSSYYGLSLLNFSTSQTTASYIGNKAIIEEQLPNKNIPYFYGISNSPLAFNITIGKETEWTEEFKMEIARWLFQKTYKPFISNDNPSIVYNCIATNSPEKILFGNVQYLVSLNFRCDAPHAWSNPIMESYDLSDNTTSEILIWENRSNYENYIYPELQIESIDGGTIKLENLQDGGRITQINNLQAGEIVTLENDIQFIETNTTGIYRLKDFNRNWLRLIYGQNQIKVTGKCRIILRSKFPIAI